MHAHRAFPAPVAPITLASSALERNPRDDVITHAMTMSCWVTRKFWFLKDITSDLLAKQGAIDEGTPVSDEVGSDRWRSCGGMSPLSGHCNALFTQQAHKYNTGLESSQIHEESVWKGEWSL